jgi:hypothetical protein
MTGVSTGDLDEAALSPIVGVVQEVFVTMYGYPQKTKATV